MTDHEQPAAGVALKPCPFCGHVGASREHCEGTILKPAYRYVCDHCGAATGYTDKGDEAKEWNTRAPTDAGGAVSEVVRLVVERAEQACRYALKHQNFEADDDGTDRYRDGWEVAADVCEKAIAEHVARHIKADLAALTPAPQAEGGKLPAISLDGPHKPGNIRRWLARQLLDSRLDDEEAFGVVADHPSISDITAPQPLQQGGEVTRAMIERAGIWANVPDDKSLAGMGAFYAFEAGKRAATDAILALFASPDLGDLAGLLERLEATRYRWTMGHRDEPPINPDGPEAARALRSLAAERDEWKQAAEVEASERRRLQAEKVKDGEALESIARPEYGLGFNKLRGLARARLSSRAKDQSQ